MKIEQCLSHFKKATKEYPKYLTETLEENKIEEIYLKKKKSEKKSTYIYICKTRNLQNFLSNKGKELSQNPRQKNEFEIVFCFEENLGCTSVEQKILFVRRGLGDTQEENIPSLHDTARMHCLEDQNRMQL